VEKEIEWKGGAVTKLEVKKRRNGKKETETDEKTVAAVTQLAQQLPDDGIVSILKRMRLKTGKGNTWTTARLRALRC